MSSVIHKMIGAGPLGEKVQLCTKSGIIQLNFYLGKIYYLTLHQ